MKHGAFDIGHVAAGDPACTLAPVCALRFSTFLTQLDVSTANLAPGARSGDLFCVSSDAARGPLAMAIQVWVQNGYSRRKNVAFLGSDSPGGGGG